MHDSIPVKPAMFYAGATNYVLQRSAGGRDSLGNLGSPVRYSVTLFTVPRSAFRCLPYVACSDGKRRKAGRGTGNEATTNLKLQTVNDE